MPHAISGVYNKNGQKGHDSTMGGLGKVVRRFTLTREMALEAIIPWNEKCEPPWSDTEITTNLMTSTRTLPCKRLGTVVNR